MDYTDPYFVLQDEITKNLDIIKSLYEELAITESSRSASDLSNKLKQVLRTIEWDLEDLQETIGLVVKDPSTFKLTNEDVAARRKFLSEVREVVKNVKTHLENGVKRGMHNSSISFSVTVSKSPNNARGLVNGTIPSKGHTNSETRLQAPASEAKSYRPSVLSVSNDPLSEQKELLRHQDERLDQLGTSISTLKGMSRRIGDELEDQVALLDDFSGEMVHTESRLDAATKRTARLLHLSTDRRQWWAIACLTIILIIILVLLVVL
ncbi:hypothetical protein P879_07224 [Paragonimus westermani]|uniref:t-SNARE coiled-coil homology domain-containing protein n=1 Tax=Paragonimus westermani TaxID=34504 RepID=A0A8T0DM66_9TREM|nr:hypothetical protein P879_07224 [Paragonimus westermani]